jgi:hypothetical protein
MTARPGLRVAGQGSRLASLRQLRAAFVAEGDSLAPQLIEIEPTANRQSQKQRTPQMKTWIILGLVMAMAASLFSEWRKHEASTPAHKQELSRQVATLHREHPDWTIEQIATQYASEASRNATLGFLVAEVIVLILLAVLFMRFGAHWWYLAVAFVLWLCASLMIV